MKNICFFILFSIITLQTLAQSFVKEAHINTSVKQARIDQFGNVYAIDLDNALIKYNNKGERLWSYSNKSYGGISYVDVVDPMRILLFYPDHQQIILLNSNLTEISRYSFTSNPDVQISLVASANNNGFWVYDQLNREISKLSNTFTDELKSSNIYQRNGFDMHANYLFSNDEYIFINDKKAGVRIFDRFCNFYKTAVIDVPSEFSVEGSKIIFSKNQRLYAYDFFSFQLDSLEIPSVDNVKNIIKHLNHLLIIAEKELTLWSLKTD